MLRPHSSRIVAATLVVLLALAAMACSTSAEPVIKEVPVDRIVERQVVKEVPVDRVVTKEVVRTEQVPMKQLAPLIVGNLNTFTGSLSEFGPPLRNSVELAADHINRAGGIQGGSMVIISRDTAVSPVQGVDAARALVDVERVAAIIGALSSGVTVAVAQSVTVPKKTLMVSGASTAPSISVLEDGDYLFRTTPSDASQGVVLARLAREQGYDTVGIMYINNAYGEGLADQFEESFTALGGTVTAKVPHEDVQPTYVSELDKATDGDSDALAVLSYTGQAAVYVREAMEGGYADAFLFADGTKGPEWIEGIDAWDALDGSMGTVQGSAGVTGERRFFDLLHRILRLPAVASVHGRALRRDRPGCTGRRQGWQHHRLHRHPGRYPGRRQLSRRGCRPGTGRNSQSPRLDSRGQGH